MQSKTNVTMHLGAMKLCTHLHIMFISRLNLRRKVVKRSYNEKTMRSWKWFIFRHQILIDRSLFLLLSLCWLNPLNHNRFFLFPVIPRQRSLFRHALEVRFVFPNDQAFIKIFSKTTANKRFNSVLPLRPHHFNTPSTWNKPINFSQFLQISPSVSNIFEKFWRNSSLMLTEVTFIVTNYDEMLKFHIAAWRLATKS